VADDRGDWVTVGYDRVEEPPTYSIDFTPSKTGRRLDVSYDKEILGIKADAVNVAAFTERLTYDAEAFSILTRVTCGEKASDRLTVCFNELSRLKQPASTARALDEEDIEKLEKDLARFRADMAVVTRKLKGALDESGLREYLSEIDLLRAVKQFTGKTVKL